MLLLLLLHWLLAGSVGHRVFRRQSRLTRHAFDLI